MSNIPITFLSSRRRNLAPPIKSGSATRTFKHCRLLGIRGGKNFFFSQHIMICWEVLWYSSKVATEITHNQRLQIEDRRKGLYVSYVMARLDVARLVCSNSTERNYFILVR